MNPSVLQSLFLFLNVVAVFVCLYMYTIRKEIHDISGFA